MPNKTSAADKPPEAETDVQFAETAVEFAEAAVEFAATPVESTDTAPGNEPPPTAVDVPTDASHRHATLSERITDAQFRYYVLDAPTMSDGEFDVLLRELQAIEG